MQLLIEVKNKGFLKIFLENIWWFQKLSLSLHREINREWQFIVRWFSTTIKYIIWLIWLSYVDYTDYDQYWKTLARKRSAKLFYDILASKFSTKLDLSGFWLKFVVMTGFSLFSLSIFRSIIYKPKHRTFPSIRLCFYVPKIITLGVRGVGLYKEVLWDNKTQILCCMFLLCLAFMFLP